MKFGVPWSVKGIRPEARETAKEAARRAGLSLGDWLNTVILQQATQAGLAGQPHGHAQHDREELAGVHQRLDDLTRRIEQFTHTGPAAYAPRRQPDEGQTAALIGRLDQRLDQFARQPAAPPLAPAMPPQPMTPPAPPSRPNVQLPPALDHALAEIAARQRALNGEPASPPTARPASAPPPAAVPTQDISGLEQQLRKITDQIETLRKPGVEEAINALRAELGDIGRALDDAMPKRAIDTIEKQISGLTQRIAEGRQAGIDAGALAGIEHGLTEVRDALHGLTPAEHLVGFTEAVEGLAQKIDLIVAQKDPATLAQLESAITTLRGMAGNVASNEAVSRLEAEVLGLADKVEQIGHGAVGDVLTNLETRIDALSHALTERAQAGNTVPPRLEALVQSLSDKIEQIQHSRGDDNIAVSHLEDRIVTLVERLDASDSRLGHLEAIERGLADLLVHIEEMRADKHSARPDESSPTVDALKQDMARTQDALDAVHGTLGLVVDRLATIEKDIRNERRAPPPAAPVAPAAPAAPEPAAASAFESEPMELTQPVGKLAVRLIDDTPEAAPAPAPAMPPHEPEEPAPDYSSATSVLEQALAASQPAIPEYTPAPAAAAPAPEPEPPAAWSPMPAEAPPAPPPPTPPAAEPAPAPPPQVQAPPTPEPAAAPQRLPAAAQLPINPDLPPDQPLEPGSGPPQLHAHHAARIAASEAALGGARPTSNTGSGQSNFIAAARRAAKAAMQQQEAAAPHAPEPAENETQDSQSLSAKMMKRVKSLLVAASIVALVVGAAQLAGHFLPLGHDGASKTAQQADSKPAASKLAAAPGKPDASSLLMPTPIGPLPHAAGKTAQRVQNPFNNPLALFNPADVTGSIPDAARNRHTAPPAPVLPPAKPAKRAEKLPAAIGNARLREAALSGDAGAAYEMAVRFAEGRGVPVDLKRAALWYERAASKGLALAQFRYASMLEKGLGVKKDLGHARRLYQAAAEQGNAKAMHNLAVLYAEGVNGKPEYATAVTWFRKAARHGVSDSQYNLGILYARGIGVRKDLGKSYKWFALAAAHGDKEAASKRDDVARRLDAKQLALARNAVAHFKPMPQPAKATTAPTPPGGWDKAAAAPAKPRKHMQHTQRPQHPQQPRGPLPLGSFTVGNR